MEVYQPQRIRYREAVEKIKALSPDLIVVTAYGQILPKEILEIPRLGCVNVHASLLPKYRGAAPINRVLIDGEAKTGITTMYMEEGLDTGDMIFQDEIEIGDDRDAQQLHDALAELSKETLSRTLLALVSGTAPRTSKNTLAKWRMSKNKGPKLAFVKIGRNILYKRDSIKQWLEDNERIDTKNLKQTKDSK